MKLIKSSSFVLLVAFLVACGSPVATMTSTLSDDPAPDGTGPLSVCSVQGLPNGWVVVAHSRTPTCPSPDFTSIDYWNTYTVMKAGASAIICDDSPLPAGYVKVSPRREIACVIRMFASVDYTNAFLIEKL